MKNTLWLVLLVLLGCRKDSSDIRVGESEAPRTEYAFDLEHLAPATAFLVINTIDWEQIRKIGQDNTWAGLLEPETLWSLRQVIGEPRDDHTWDWLDPLGSVLKAGGSAVAFAQFDPETDDGTLAILLESPQQKDDFEQLWSWLKTQAGPDASVSEETLLGNPVRFVQNRKCLALIEHESFQGMVLSGDRDRARETARGILMRAQGDHTDSMAANPGFVEASLKHPPGTIASAFLDWSQLYPEIERNASPMEVRTLKALHIPRFRWACADLVLGKNEYASLEIRLPVEAETLWDQALQHTAQLSLGLLDSLPAESLALALVNVRLNDLLTTVEQTLHESLPEAALGFRREFERASESFGFNIRQDLLATWTGEGVGSLVPIPWSTPTFRRRRSRQNPLESWTLEYAPTTILRFTNPERVESTLKQAVIDAAGVQEELSGFEMGEYRIYRIPDNSKSIGLNWTFSEDKLLLSADLAATQRCMQRLDGVERLNRSAIEGMRRQLDGHSQAFAAIVVESRTVASVLVNSLRAQAAFDEDGMGQVRWPSNYALTRRLEGYSTLAFSYEDQVLRLAVRAR